MLIKSHRQESLSRAYIQAIAGRCGMNCSLRDFDYGIDVTLHEITLRKNRYVETGFNLDVQAKSTGNAVLHEEHIQFDLAVKNYDDLRDSDVGTPQILVVLVMPAEEAQWTTMTEDQLLLRKCAYWLSLKGREATTNTDSIRVDIPRANLFSMEALHAMMQRIRLGEEL